MANRVRVIMLVVAAIVAPPSVDAAAVQRGTQSWPKAKIPYHIDSKLLKLADAKGRDCKGWSHWSSQTQAYKACKAMSEWQQATGVQFVTAGERLDTLNIIGSQTATNATLGYLPIGNIMQIEAKASYGAVLHEFGHVLGLMHEHQRPDRNQYLTLSPFLQNDLDHCGLSLSAVCNDVRVAFPVVKVQMSSAYDPCSIMQYLSDQTPRHREDSRWSHIFSLTDAGKFALQACLPQFYNLPSHCQKAGQKCAISRNDALIVRRFEELQ